MASMEEIKKELIGVLQKEIDQNVADQESAMNAYTTQREAIDKEVKELQRLEITLIDAQTTGQKLAEVFKSVQDKFPDAAKADIAAEAADAVAATIEVRK